MFVAVLFFLLVSRGFGQPITTTTPEFISKPEILRVTLDDTVTLPCQTHNLGPFILVWRKGTTLLSAGQLMVTQEKRFSLVNKYDLQVKNVQQTDQGDYTCQIGDGSHGDLIHTIEILQPPTVQITPSSGHLTSKKGGSAVFECKATGNPSPEIRWSKKGGYLPNGQKTTSGAVLTISYVERQHSGSYQCFADNRIGHEAMAEVQLHVLFPPEIEVSQTWISSSYDIITIKLDCVVRSDPVAQVIWHQNSFRVQANDRISMSRNGNVHSLTIRNIQVNDFGNYSCVAENSLGKNKQYTEISGKPSVAKLTGSNYADSSQYLLKWSVQSIFAIQEVRILYRRIVFNSTYQYPSPWSDIVLKNTRNNDQHKLTNLIPDSVYESMIQTRNQYGWSSLSEIHQWFTNRWHQKSPDSNPNRCCHRRQFNYFFISIFISFRFFFQ